MLADAMFYGTVPEGDSSQSFTMGPFALSLEQVKGPVAWHCHSCIKVTDDPKLECKGRMFLEMKRNHSSDMFSAKCLF